MQCALSNQLIDPGAWLEVGVQLQQGFRPQQAVLQFVIYMVTNSFVLDIDEASYVVGVVCNQSISQSKDVHALLLSTVVV